MSENQKPSADPAELMAALAYGMAGGFVGWMCGALFFLTIYVTAMIQGKAEEVWVPALIACGIIGITLCVRLALFYGDVAAEVYRTRNYWDIRFLLTLSAFILTIIAIVGMAGVLG